VRPGNRESTVPVSFSTAIWLSLSAFQ